MQTDPRAGQLADPSMWVDIPRLMTAYYTRRPDASVPEQRVAFGTSGHRGSAFDCAFNEDHILAIAIRAYRWCQEIVGFLFLGIAFPGRVEVHGRERLVADPDRSATFDSTRRSR
jgi:phosphoglucomutase